MYKHIMYMAEGKSGLTQAERTIVTSRDSKKIRKVFFYTWEYGYACTYALFFGICLHAFSLCVRSQNMYIDKYIDARLHAFILVWMANNIQQYTCMENSHAFTHAKIDASARTHTYIFLFIPVFMTTMCKCV